MQSLWTVLPFLVWLVVQAARKRSCPECGEPLPFFQSPLTKTRRQWVEGGYVCRLCGCESNLKGERVAPGAALNRGAFLRRLALLAAAGITGAVLLAFINWRTPFKVAPSASPIRPPAMHPQPPLFAAPPVIDRSEK